MKTTYSSLFLLLLFFINKNSFAQTCTVPTTERDALIAIYNATGGANWTNNTNWDIAITNTDVCNWYGVTVENGHVTSISLLNNNLTGTIPTALSDLLDITSINFSGNNITGSIPNSLTNLTALTALVLDGNGLTGPVPYIQSLTQPLPSSEVAFTIADNAFVFSDIENSLSSYVSNNIPLYAYSPQGKVDQEETIDLVIGGNHLFSTSLNNSNNNYQWYKDGVAISGATNQAYSITGATVADQGVYHVEITNPNVASLTIERNTITLTTNTCTVPQSEKDALIALYDATAGANWTNKTNWKTSAPVCDWFGVTVENGTVTEVSLNENNLTGIIPSSIGDLTNLKNLSLYLNSLVGAIPSTIGNLVDLEALILSNNQLTSIPSSIESLSNLETFYASDNQFSGAIPSEIGSLTNLVELSLHFNQFTGSIPSSFSSLRGLYFMHLNNNQLSGSFPTGLSTLTNFAGFRFHNNKFVFNHFETQHVALTNTLTSFYTYSPQAKVDQEETVNASEDASYTFTTSLSSTNNSYQWYKDGVAITGATSKDYTINSLVLADAGVYYVVATNSIITGLTLQRNNITLAVTANTCSVSQSEKDALIALYDATGGDNWINKTNWKTSASVCDWYGVTVENGTVTEVSLNENNLVGTISSSLEDLTNLNKLSLYLNSLSGAIPSNVGNLTNLKTLILSNNQLTSIPSSIGNLSNLEVFYASDNQFSGAIPSEIGLLTNLSELSLHFNQFNGNIPNSFSGLNGLAFMHLNNNQLSGTFPSGLSELGNFRGFRFQSNKFVFRDFETKHIAFTNALVNFYTYSPQAKVDQEETINALLNSSVTLATSLSSGNNTYQWQFSNDNGVTFVNIDGATSRNYVIQSVSPSDIGVYRLIANNTIVTGLTLERHPITLKLDTLGLCGIPNSVRDILLEFYNATNGDEWINTQQNNKPWDINTPVCDWYGIFTSVHPVTGKTSVGGIDLKNNNLVGHIPGSFGDLPLYSSLDLRYNKLSGGSVPIIKTAGSVYLNHNEFVFSDFEENNDENKNYPRADEEVFFYSPQAKVDQIETRQVAEGSVIPLVLTSNRLTNPNNTYQWYKNGEAIPEATSKEYIITNPTTTDAGIYHFLADNPDFYRDGILWKLTLERHPINVIVVQAGSENKFCASDWPDYPTVGDLTPNGDNIVWYATETAGVSYNKTDELIDEVEDTGGTTYWWDDTSDSVTTRIATNVLVGSTPEGFTEQMFSIFQEDPSPKISDIEAYNGDDAIYWYASDSSTTVLSVNTPLVNGVTYYASLCDQADDSCLCRLPVTITFGILPPKGDSVQYLCEGATFNDIVVERENNSISLVWYTTESGGNALDEETTTIVNGNTYYVAQNYNEGEESIERLKILVFTSSVDPPVVLKTTQKFYADESQTVANLQAFGNDIKWYSQETGGNAYPITTALVGGTTYYAEQNSKGGECPSTERVAVTVELSTEIADPLLGCELFRPELLEHYVIDGWLSEREVTSQIVNQIPFNNSDESRLFVTLLNHLKNRLLSDNPQLYDIPKIYEPELLPDEPQVDLAPLMAFIEGLEVSEKKLIVYDFEPITDDYLAVGKGRTIGFSFYLNAGKTRQVIYKTPTFTYTVPEVVTNTGVVQKPKTEHYPLLDNIDYPSDELLNFTKVEVAQAGGAFKIFSDFKSTVPTVTTVNQEETLSDTGVVKYESVRYEYTEVPYQAIPNYDSARIEVSFVDENNQDIGDPLVLKPQGGIIDKWQKVTADFVIPGNAGKMIIALRNTDDNKLAYFDDLRILPFDSNMKTFVYHPENQRLMSELDENNYATFYEYDLEGGLVRVKKETEKGIYTIQETRSGNVKASN